MALAKARRRKGKTQPSPAEAGRFESFVSYGLKSFDHEEAAFVGWEVLSARLSVLLRFVLPPTGSPTVWSTHLTPIYSFLCKVRKTAKKEIDKRREPRRPRRRIPLIPLLFFVVLVVSLWFIFCLPQFSTISAWRFKNQLGNRPVLSRRLLVPAVANR